MAILRQISSKLVLSRGGQVFQVSAEEVYSSVIEGNSTWEDVSPGHRGVEGELKFSRFPLIPKLVVQQKSDGQLPLLEIWLFKDEKALVLAEQSVLEEDQFIHEGSWYALDEEASSDVKQILLDKSVEIGEVTSLRAYLNLKKLALDGLYIIDRDVHKRISPVSLLPSSEAHPKGVVGTLYPYQVDGWNWLRMIVSEGIGGVLADEMGLGKTLQVISVVTDPGARRMGATLIVAPGSLLENWRREFQKFSPSISCLKHHGPHRTGDPKVFSTVDVVVTTYDSIVRDLSMFMMVSWSLVVLDEAQNIKSPDAKRTVAVKNLDRYASLCVTGTPIENKLLDIWSILDFSCPGYLGDRKSFENRFSNEENDAAELEPLISPLILRREVSEVATDLPIRIDIPQVLELGELEAQAYERLRESIEREYSSSASLVALTKLRMFCSHPLLIDRDELEVLGISNLVEFSKLERLGEITEEIFSSSEKVIIFSTYTKASDRIVEYIQFKFGVASACLDGRMPMDDRQCLIDEFSQIDGPAAMVLNPRAGGSGLNITAANHVIHYNLEWNPALEDQASARSYRRGQDLPVTIHRLYYANTVEEVVNQRLERKRAISDAGLVGSRGRQEDFQDILKALQVSPVTQL